MGAGHEAEAVRAALAAWRAEHPQATFDEIEDEVYRQLAGLHAQWMGELAPPPAACRDADLSPTCPACGVVLRPRGTHRRQVVTRMGQATTLTRRYWVCPACGAGRFPPG